MTDDVTPLLLARMSDSVILVNAAGEIAEINPAAEKILGIPAAAAMGKPVYEVFPDLAPLLDEPGLVNEIQRELAVRTPGAVREFDATRIPLPASGDLLLLREIRNSPSQDEAIRISEQRFRELVDLLPEIVFEADLFGKFTFVNDNSLRFFGYTREDMERGLNLFDHIIPGDIARVRQDMTRIAAGGSSRGGEYIGIKRDGSRFPFVVYTTPVMQGGRCTGIRGILIDMTGHKRTEYALQQAIKKLSLLNSMTRHDIINKLTSLSAFLDMARQATADPDAAGHIDRCIAIVAALDQHVRFMKDYQAIGTCLPVWLDPATVIRDVSAACDPAGIRIQVPDPGWEIFSDPVMRKVILNLITNAARHGGQVTTIVFSLAETSRGLSLVCEDDGCGVADENKSRIFQKGFLKNTGQGLFLAREVLAITGISIEETGTYGKGARFEIVVPAGNYRRSGIT
jgi:PAS domain S-box-containing protein